VKLAVCKCDSLRRPEEGEYEYVSDHQSGKEGKAEAHIEPAVLYQPLPEAASSEGSEHGQPELGGNYHDASGDGCGDGGYCRGHWVRRSEPYYRIRLRCIRCGS
jgi:hypothetical protein